MVIVIHKTHRGWSFAGPGPETRVKMPEGAEWLEVKGTGLCLFVPVGGRLRAWWSAARVAEEVEAGRLKVVGRRAKRTCA